MKIREAAYSTFDNVAGVSHCLRTLNGAVDGSVPPSLGEPAPVNRPVSAMCIRRPAGRDYSALLDTVGVSYTNRGTSRAARPTINASAAKNIPYLRRDWPVVGFAKLS